MQPPASSAGGSPSVCRPARSSRESSPPEDPVSSGTQEGPSWLRPFERLEEIVDRRQHGAAAQVPSRATRLATSRTRACSRAEARTRCSVRERRAGWRAWRGPSPLAAPGAPQLDFVFTVCDDAANEVCPIWPGQPMTAHWGVPDPSVAQGSEAEKRYAFADAYRMLYQRIGIFVNLPLASLHKLALQKKLRDIGTSSLPAPAQARQD